MKNNVALIGFMGTGKTAVGRTLASRLAWKLVETDALIEKMAGKSIPDIFRHEGEIAFRDYEIAVCKQVANGKKQVIACGGGVVLNTINIARLRIRGVMVLLQASPTAIVQRVEADNAVRPLLANAADRSARIKELFKFRKPFYAAAADIVIDTSKLSVEAVTDTIIENLRNYEGFDFPK